MRRQLAVLVLVASTGSAAVAADLDPCWCSTPTWWGGASYSTVVSDGVTPRAVALGYGSPLLLDVSDPAAPVAIFPGSSAHQVPPHPDWDLELPAVTGDTLIGAVDDDVVLLDLRTADQTWDAAATLAGLEPWAVAAGGGRAAVLTGSLELRLYDVHEAQAPQLLGAADLAVATRDSLLALRGDLAVLAAPGAPLHVVDLANPSAPTVVGSTGVFDDPRAQSLQLDAGRAYYCSQLFTGPATVHIVDLAVPAAPLVVGELAADSCRVRAVGTRLYVRDSGGLIQVWDVAQPSQPTLLGTVPASGSQFTVAGGSVVSAGDSDGVYVTSLTAAAESDAGEVRFRARTFGYPLPYWRLALRGGVLFAVELERVWALDVADSTAPKELGWWDGATDIRALALAGRSLLVLDTAGRLTALDASDPAGLTATGELLVDTGARVVAADAGRNAVAGEHLLELVTLDEAGNLHAGAVMPVVARLQPETVAIAGPRLAYYTSEPDSDGWLHVLDISNPAAPVELARLSPRSDLAPGTGVDRVSDVEAAGGVFYVVSTGYGWSSVYSYGVVVDPRPVGPPLLGDSFAAYVDVALHGSVIATGYQFFGAAVPVVRLIDSRAPERWLEPYPSLYWAENDGLSATDGRRFFTFGYGGLLVYDFGCCRLPEVFSDFLDSGDTTAWSETVSE